MIKSFLRSKLLRKKISFRPYVNKKFEPFTYFEITEIKSKLEKVNSKFKDIKIELLSEDLIKVCKRVWLWN